MTRHEYFRIDIGFDNGRIGCDSPLDEDAKWQEVAGESVKKCSKLPINYYDAKWQGKHIIISL